MPRNLKLRPVERDILWLLDEAGAETFRTVVVTLPQYSAQQLLDATAHLQRLTLVSAPDHVSPDSEILLTFGARSSHLVTSTSPWISV